MSTETLIYNGRESSLSVASSNLSSQKPFITANTEECSLQELRQDHIIPVFLKDNEPLISHTDFIEAVQEAAADHFRGENILSPAVRVSHPIKGRIPEAKLKRASELMDWEKTLYYERMAFALQIPSIYDEVEGSHLSLTIGGVKAYNLDNMSGKKGSQETFKVFIGFQNKVCTNLCIWTDGFSGELKVRSLEQLRSSVGGVIAGFSATRQLEAMQRLSSVGLSERQFATLVGRCRMYGHLPPKSRQGIPQWSLTDTQLGAVVRDYYEDPAFRAGSDGSLSLWRFYNLMTGAAKSTYIDSFLERSLGAYQFSDMIREAMDGQAPCWYLD